MKMQWIREDGMGVMDRSTNRVTRWKRRRTVAFFPLATKKLTFMLFSGYKVVKEVEEIAHHIMNVQTATWNLSK